jgi:hypothetical protein
MRIGRAAGLVLSFALAAAFASTGPAAAFSFGHKPKPEPAAPPAPPPEPEIAVGAPVLANYVVETAGAYATYMNSASAIGSSFASGDAVLTALKIGEHSEQHQMQQGIVAYAAILALQDPTFTATVRSFANHASTRDTILRNILADPNYVVTLNGHDSAAGIIVSTLYGQGQKLKSAGELIQQASLDIQLKAAWSKKAAPDQPGTLAAAKQLSSAAIIADQSIKAQLAQASSGAQPMSLAPASAQQPYSQTVIRGMAIAALAILGKAGDDDLNYLMPLLVNDGDGFCFSMSKLNLFQCLSVARPHYENMYCLGLHAMSDTGRCVMTSVGQPAAIASGGPAATAATGPVAAASSSGPVPTAALSTAALAQ